MRLWVLALLFLVPVAHAAVSSYVPADGWDASNSTPVTFTSSDLSRLNGSDDSRMQTSAWSGLSQFDEARYVEFIFSPNVSGTVTNASLVFEYRRNGALDGAKLEVWDGTVWRNESIGIPDASASDASYTVSLPYLTAANSNNLKVRFLGFRNASGTSQTTSHDFVQLVVDRNNPPAIALVSPKNGEYLSGTRTMTWTATDDESLSVSVSYRKEGVWTVLSPGESNDGEYLLDTRSLQDGAYELQLTASDSSLSTAASVAVVIDNTAPALHYVMAAPKTPRRNSSVTVVVRARDASSIAGTLNGTSYQFSGAEGVWTAAVPATAGTMNLVLADSAGNAMNASVAVAPADDGADAHVVHSALFTNTSFSAQLGSTVVAVSVHIVPAVNGTISVASYRTAPHLDSAKGWVPKFIELDTIEPLMNNLIAATISISYSDAEIAGLEESSLSLYFYNASSLSWQPVASVVNTTARTVSAPTTHLSLWGIAGEKKTTTTTVLPPAAVPPVSAATATTQVPPGSAEHSTTTSTSGAATTSVPPSDAGWDAKIAVIGTAAVLLCAAAWYVREWRFKKRLKKQLDELKRIKAA